MSPATVVVVERQHKPNTPDVFELFAVCADRHVAAEVMIAAMDADAWRDIDDFRWNEQTVLTSVPEAMTG